MMKFIITFFVLISISRQELNFIIESQFYQMENISFNKQNNLFQINFPENFEFTLIRLDQEILKERNPNIQLAIEINFHSITLSYCEKGYKPLKQSEFNDPPFSSLIKIKNFPKEWFQFLSEETIIELINKGAFRQFNDWRCRSFSMHEYQENFDLEIKNIELKVWNQLKSQIDLRNIFLMFHTWRYSSYASNEQLINQELIINQKGYLNYIILKNQPEYLRIGSKCLLENWEECQINTPIGGSYSVSKRIEGEGLHQQMYTNITIESECKRIGIIEYLDIYTYIDKDELDKLNLNVKLYVYYIYQYQIQTIIDIEKPAEHSPQHILIIFHQLDKQQKTFEYFYPYHFRYQLPGDTFYKKGFVPQYPIIYADCGEFSSSDINSKVLSVTFSGSFQPLQIEKQIKPKLSVEIPVGYEPHQGIIFIFTIGLTLGLSIYLSKLIVTETKTFR